MTDRVTSAASSVLTDLALGKYGAYLQTYREAPASLEPLARADLALYVGELEAARAALDESPPGELRDVLEAELSLAAGDRSEAKRFLGRHRSPRAVLNHARAFYGRARWRGVLATARILGRVAGDENPYLRGRASHLVGMALHYQGLPGSLTFLRMAVTDLAATENLRFAALAENGRGAIFLDEGGTVQAVKSFGAALKAAEEVGHVADILMHGGALACAQYLSGDYEATLRRGAEHAEMARGTANARAECYGLWMAIVSALALNRPKTAASFCGAFEAAAIVEIPETRLLAEALSARTRIRSGRRLERDRLLGLVERSAAFASSPHGVLIRLWIWDMVSVAEPTWAPILEAELREPARSHPDAMCRAEYVAVAQLQRPLRRVHGRWIFDTRGDEQAAVRAVRAAMFEDAWGETAERWTEPRGFQKALAARLGLTEARVSQIAKARGKTERFMAGLTGKSLSIPTRR